MKKKKPSGEDGAVNSAPVWHSHTALEATQGQNDSFFSQLPYKCYLKEVASVGD